MRKCLNICVALVCWFQAFGYDIVVNTTEDFLLSPGGGIEAQGFRIGYRYLTDDDGLRHFHAVCLNAYFGEDVVSIEIPSHIMFRIYADNEMESLIKTERVSITSVMPQSFAGLKNLTKIIIPETITYIGYKAFAGCAALKEVSINAGITEIGTGAFQDCASLEKVSFNCSDVKNINITKSAFNGCENLKTILFGATYNGNDFSLFDDIGTLQEYQVDDANQSYSSYKGLLCDKSQTKLVACPRSIRNMIVPGTFRVIDEYAFAWLYELESVIVNEGVETICAGAFSYNEKLATVRLPSSVKEIGNSAFLGCSSLVDIELNEGLLSIGEETFSDCPFTEINLPTTLTSIGYWAFGFSGLKTIEIPEGADLGNMAFYGCQNLENAILPGSITTIPMGLFEYCPSLTNVSLSEGLTHISDFAFCSYGEGSLYKITFPSTLESVGESIFGSGVVSNVVFLGRPPAVEESTFGGIAEDCVGYYTSIFASDWLNVIDLEGRWNGLLMKELESPALSLTPVDADWRIGSISFKCDDADTSGTAHTYSLAYSNQVDDVWVLADGDAAKNVPLGSDGYAHLSDTKFASRNNGVGTVKYRVMDETGRVAECVTRHRHGLFAAINNYENGWAGNIREPHHEMAVFRDTYKRYAGIDKYLRTMTDQEVTKEGLITGIESFANYPVAGDIVVFYFCGHGINGGLVCYDKDRIVWGYELATAFDKFQSGVAVVAVLYACYSGSVIDMTSLGNNVAWIYSSAADEKSKSGMFTDVLCYKGWMDGFSDDKVANSLADGDGYITFAELAEYGQQEMGANFDTYGRMMGYQNSIILDNIVLSKVPDQNKANKRFRWYTQSTGSFPASEGNMEVAFATTAANGIHTIADCYELGIDPDNPDDDFRITHFEMVNGEPVFELNHTTDGSGESFIPRIKKLGKADLKDNWTEVPPGGDPSHRFFTVEVETP